MNSDVNAIMNALVTTAILPKLKYYILYEILYHFDANSFYKNTYMPNIDDTFPLYEAILLYRELYKQLVFYVAQSTF